MKQHERLRELGENGITFYLKLSVNNIIVNWRSRMPVEKNRRSSENRWDDNISFEKYFQQVLFSKQLNKNLFNPGLLANYWRTSSD